VFGGAGINHEPASSGVLTRESDDAAPAIVLVCDGGEVDWGGRCEVKEGQEGPSPSVRVFFKKRNGCGRGG
jgi:hypothetical protein